MLFSKVALVWLGAAGVLGGPTIHWKNAPAGGAALSAAERQSVDDLEEGRNHTPATFKRLAPGLKTAQGDVLANELARLLNDPSPVREMIRRLLTVRASEGWEGGYLSALAEATITALGNDEPVPTDEQVVLLNYLQPSPEHQPDPNLVGRAEGAAEENAQQVAECPQDLELSWRLLICLGTLHDGITLADATALLGPPSKVERHRVDWHPASACRVHSELRATLEEDRLVGFQTVHR